ncbi:MAG TPA: PspA/IM30 family protein, partial [Thermomicrobiales bacterium]|nr:PspA/IM30 family protein [Thermomicrobiales bacterium]
PEVMLQESIEEMRNTLPKLNQILITTRATVIRLEQGKEALERREKQLVNSIKAALNEGSPESRRLAEDDAGSLQQIRLELQTTRDQLATASKAFENSQITVEDIKQKLRQKMEESRKAITESRNASALRNAASAIAELDTYGTAATNDKYLDEIRQKSAEAKAAVEVATGGLDVERAKHDLFGEEFLLKRPLLQAIDAAHEKSPVLLIDEVDRADAELEAFLLELLSDFQVTVPELGTIRAEHVPIVILTSNRTREIHDALKRRCLYYWIDFPTFQKEYRILSAKVPEAPQRLATQVCAFTQGLREVDLFKSPGMAETLDWAHALLSLGTTELTNDTVDDTLGVILKYQEDVDRVRGDVANALISRAARATAD